MKKWFLHVLWVSCISLSASMAQAEVVPLDRVIAIVDNGVVLESELNDRVSMFEQRFEAKGTPLPSEKVMRERLLDQLVVEQIELQMAARLGIRVSDSQLNQTMESIAQQNGLTLDAFQEQLIADGISYQSAREQVKREMLVSQLQQRSVGSRIRITDKEVDDFLKSAAGQAKSQEEYHTAHILLSNNDSTDTAALAKELVAKIKDGASFSKLAATYSSSSTALDGGDLGWRTQDELPTLFAEIVPKLRPGELADPIETSGGVHLVMLTETRGGTTKMVSQSRVSHVLIMPNEVRDELEVKALIEELHDRALAGEDFAVLAKTYSDDAVSSSSGGSLNWVSPGEMVPEFEQVMNATAKGEISARFKSSYGWHILRIEDRRMADVGDKVQASQARQILHRRRYERELQSWLGEIRDEAFVEIKI